MGRNSKNATYWSMEKTIKNCGPKGENILIENKSEIPINIQNIFPRKQLSYLFVESIVEKTFWNTK